MINFSVYLNRRVFVMWSDKDKAGLQMWGPNKKMLILSGWKKKCRQVHLKHTISVIEKVKEEKNMEASLRV